LKAEQAFMKFTCIFIAVIFSVLSAARAQSILSASYPFGLPLRPLSGTALCMGGVSTGVINDHHVMLSNPGNLGFIGTTAFSSLLSIDYLRIEEKSTYTDHISFIPRQISFALPLGAAGTLAFSLTKDTETKIKYRQDKVDITSADPLHPQYYRLSYDCEGGTTSWQGGWGYKINKYFSAGLAYQRSYFMVNSTKLEDFTFAEIEFDTTLSPDSVITNIKTTETVKSIVTVRDSTHQKAGINCIRLGCMGTFKDISLGLAFNYYLKERLNYNNALYNYDDKIPVDSATITNAKITMQYPPSLFLGASYAFSPKWLIGADLSFEFWKLYSLDIDDIPEELTKSITRGIADIEKENTVSIAGGVRFIPAPNLLVPKYWETVHFRAGMRYSQLPGKKSSEYSGSLGVGLLLRGNGLLDLGLEAGKRSHEKFSGYDESFVQILIGINGGRKWSKSGPDNY